MLFDRAGTLLTPSPRTTPDRWATQNRTYPVWADRPGPRDPYLTPYIIEPERVVAEGRGRRVVLVTASQSAKSESILDLMGHRLDQRPVPCLYVGPNKQFVTEQFEPRVVSLFDQAPTLMAKVQRGKKTTKTRKVVAGVPVRLAHAGSSAALKSDPAGLAFVDEYDEMLANVKGQGDPLGLVEHRGDTFADFVCLVTSTPKKGVVHPELDQKSGLAFWGKAPSDDVRESPIWNLWQQGTRHHWCWPCLHCGEYFVPRFDRLRWPEGATATEARENAWIECPRPQCGGVMQDQDKRLLNDRGRYVAPGQTVNANGFVDGEPEKTLTISFWVSGLCSPFVTFGERAAEYIEAEALGDSAMVQRSVNAGFGELYAPGGRDIKEWQQIARRRLPHRFGEVPDKVVRVTAAVDVQKTALYWSKRGWGERGTSWQIESGFLHGYTDQPEVWTDLANVLLDDCEGLHVSLALIDSGFRPDKPEEGWTNVVYEFCRRFKSFCRPTKGYDKLDAPIKRGVGKVTIPGRGTQQEIDIVRLDTDFWKTRLHERLAWPHDQPGGFHLSADATDDYCKQLVSEVRVVAPSGKPEWVKVSRQNHFLDVEAMNEAAGHMIGAQKIPLGMTHAGEKAAKPVRPAAPAEPTPQMPAMPPRDPWVGRRGWFGR
ncbi:terminase gpA endonuclease subunit [Bradyrhizobium paxllaeri]|uniref:terminase gpA endonuclease subunit n=1 Tax=Bradyrhizobium paxllaeri TaxID=190148 RepID=UPI001FE4AE5B|nr:terminase gpA endonuclease subunit [Bradyrhizobium paxllaeri]